MGTWGFVQYEIKICVKGWVPAPTFTHGTFVDNCPLPAPIQKTKLIIRPDGEVRYKQEMKSGVSKELWGKAYSAENGDMHLEIDWGTGKSWVRKVKHESPDILAIERFWFCPQEKKVMTGIFQRGMNSLSLV